MRSANSPGLSPVGINVALWVTVAALSLFTLAGGPSHAQTYTATDIGSPGGATDPSALGVNDSGQIVGYGAVANGTQDFIWSSTGTTVLVHPNPRVSPYITGSQDAAINNSGDVTGSYSENSSPPQVAYLYTGSLAHLGGPGVTIAAGAGINSSGVVVGSAQTTTKPGHAYLWTTSTGTDLGTLGGATSGANAINDSGVIVGESLTSSGGQHAFKYSSGTMTDLGTLSGMTTSDAQAINSSGEIVGGSAGSAGELPFLYSGGTMTSLGTLGGPSGWAYGISDSGQVVGSADISPPSDAAHAFLWNGTSMIDLNSVTTGLGGITLQSAVAISKTKGYIAAEGQDSSGVDHVFLLTPNG